MMHTLVVLVAVAAAVAAEGGIEQNAGYGTGAYGKEYETEHYGYQKVKTIVKHVPVPVYKKVPYPVLKEVQVVKPVLKTIVKSVPKPYPVVRHVPVVKHVPVVQRVPVVKHVPIVKPVPVVHHRYHVQKVPVHIPYYVHKPSYGYGHGGGYH
ncbi:zinc finger protein 512B-like [Amphibalanus amphitrite]|uniref:zinc finger protein 512B-like n=1 Tax=Amphibalanus amphitrite TaxID=1232801 RepID=UPI001C92452D|nr:zinc finger protein 512B-like [Amphibalanus amphitrite]XP_043243294.1 zinc finger protein 512B-like [Amphibalanus amphitrite]